WLARHGRWVLAALFAAVAGAAAALSGESLLWALAGGAAGYALSWGLRPPASEAPLSGLPERGSSLLRLADGVARRAALLPARHPLAGIGEVVLGRGEGPVRDGSTLRIGIRDPSISTVHARLRREGETWHVQDCGSTNGTFVGGEPIAERELADGDVLEMGHV